MIKRYIYTLIQPFINKANYYFNVSYFKEIPIKDILSSGEAGISSNQYSRMINQPLRSSRRILNSPHTQFLKEYRQIGEKIFEKEYFETTPYYNNALTAIRFTGFYFEAKSPDQIIKIAKNFIAATEGRRPDTHSHEHGHNHPDDPIEVRAISHSNCYELIHGNHRLASAVVDGKKHILVKVQKEKVTTPAQDMVRDVIFDVFWQRRKVELYQPIDLPEFSSWTVVRRCTDRASYISSFLKGTSYTTSIDINCSYGWFVKFFKDNGYDAKGINMDPFSLKVAENIYGISSENLIQHEIIDWLNSTDNKYEIVTCFNFIHHCILGRTRLNGVDVLKLLDKVTDKVLFIDVAEEHEAIFNNSFLGWSSDYIIHVIIENTTFTKVYPLGRDSDNSGDFQNAFGRTLFACVRS